MTDRDAKTNPPPPPVPARPRKVAAPPRPAPAKVPSPLATSPGLGPPLVPDLVVPVSVAPPTAPPSELPKGKRSDPPSIRGKLGAFIAVLDALRRLFETTFAKAIGVALVVTVGGGSFIAQIFGGGGGTSDEDKKRIAELEKEKSVLEYKIKQIDEQSRKSDRELARYLYYVLPKTGVKVDLPEGEEPPPKLEFLPTPEVSPNKVKGKDWKPIQPAEPIPMPAPAQGTK